MLGYLYRRDVARRCGRAASGMEMAAGRGLRWTVCPGPIDAGHPGACRNKSSGAFYHCYRDDRDTGHNCHGSGRLASGPILPVAEQLAHDLVNLPVHRRVSLRHVEPIVAAIAAEKKEKHRCADA
jgi:hypothetical protein